MANSLLRTNFGDLSIVYAPWLHRWVTPVPSTVSPDGRPHIWIHSQETSLPAGWNPCAKWQFVFSAMAPLYLDSQSGWDSRAETVHVNRTRTDLNTDSLHSLITPPRVTPVLSTLPPVIGPCTWIHSWETSLPDHTIRWNHCARWLFFLPWPPCSWIHS